MKDLILFALGSILFWHLGKYIGRHLPHWTMLQRLGLFFAVLVLWLIVQFYLAQSTWFNDLLDAFFGRNYPLSGSPG